MQKSIAQNHLQKYGRNELGTIFMDRGNWGHIANGTGSEQPKLKE